MSNITEVEERIKRLEDEIHHIMRLDEKTFELEEKLNKALGLLIRVVENNEKIDRNDLDYLLLKVDANKSYEVPRIKTILINLKNEANTCELNIDEAFWDKVVEIRFESPCIEFRMKNGEIERIMHYWAYKEINKATHLELDKYLFYEREGCKYRFPKENEAFLDWIWEESKKRGVFTQY